MEVHKVVSVFVLVAILPIRVFGIEQNGTFPSLDGLAVIAAKLEHIQNKLIEIDFVMKEDRETIDQRLSHHETLSAGLLWAINQLSQTIGQNLTEDRANVDQKLSGVSGAINRLSFTIGHNMSDLQALSNKMIAQQSACANHKQMRKEIQMIAPDNVPVQLNRSSESIPTSVPYRSCKEVPSKQSGTLLLQPTALDTSFTGYCEQNTFGSGWLVFQLRHNGSENFNRDWNSYRDGFGNVEGEFWLGLETLHRITSARAHELLLELKDFSGNYYYAWYSEFEIAAEIEQYAITKLGSYKGTLGTYDMSYNNGSKFATIDRDNEHSCASTRKGAWWYKNCSYMSLNGILVNEVDPAAAMFFYKNSHIPIAYSRMMIREV